MLVEVLVIATLIILIVFFLFTWYKSYKIQPKLVELKATELDQLTEDERSLLEKFCKERSRRKKHSNKQ